jgi:hypothetical protein
MIASLLLLTTAFILLFPETPAARLLHRYLAEKPADLLARIERKHVIFAIVGVFVLLSAGEMLAILGSDVAVLIAWDMSLYLDAAIAVWTASALTRIRSAWSVVCSRVRSIAFRAKSRAVLGRQAKTRRNPGSSPPANDDDRHPGYQMAA